MTDRVLGLVLVGVDKGLVRSPLNTIKRDNAHVIRTLARELGLTPSGRAALGTTQAPMASTDAARLLS